MKIEIIIIHNLESISERNLKLYCKIFSLLNFLSYLYEWHGQTKFYFSHAVSVVERRKWKGKKWKNLGLMLRQNKWNRTSKCLMKKRKTSLNLLFGLQTQALLLTMFLRTLPILFIFPYSARSFSGCAHRRLNFRNIWQIYSLRLISIRKRMCLLRATEKITKTALEHWKRNNLK